MTLATLTIIHKSPNPSTDKVITISPNNTPKIPITDKHTRVLLRDEQGQAIEIMHFARQGDNLIITEDTENHVVLENYYRYHDDGQGVLSSVSDDGYQFYQRTVRP